MFSPRRTTISGRKVKESEIDEFVRLCKSCDFEMSVNRYVFFYVLFKRRERTTCISQM
jgi:hypothetical protein